MSSPHDYEKRCHDEQKKCRKVLEVLDTIAPPEIPAYQGSTDDPFVSVYMKAHAEHFAGPRDQLTQQLMAVVCKALEVADVAASPESREGILVTVLKDATNRFRHVDKSKVPAPMMPQVKKKAAPKPSVSEQKVTKAGSSRLRLHAEARLIGKARLVIYEERDAARVWDATSLHEALQARWPDAEIERDSVLGVLGTMCRSQEMRRVRYGGYTKRRIDTSGMTGITRFVRSLFTADDPMWTIDDVIRRLVNDHGHSAEKVRSASDAALRAMVGEGIAVRIGKTYIWIDPDAPVQSIVRSIMAHLPKPSSPFRIAHLQSVMGAPLYKGQNLTYNQLRDGLRALHSKDVVKLISDGTYQLVR